MLRCGFTDLKKNKLLFHFLEITHVKKKGKMNLNQPCCTVAIVAVVAEDDRSTFSRAFANPTRLSARSKML
jgi:hypothetical protein